MFSCFEQIDIKIGEEGVYLYLVHVFWFILTPNPSPKGRGAEKRVFVIVCFFNPNRVLKLVICFILIYLPKLYSFNFSLN